MERAGIEVVAGDGARWIDECVSEHFPNAVRCVDFFHVVGWANGALDKVRLSAAAKARRAYAAKAIKGAKHALGHSPENRTANQDQMIALIEAEQPDLWAAYQLKERLRLILHMRDADEAAVRLDEWMEDASSCGLAPMEELAEKIARHRESILSSVRLQANSAKSEACNTTIKALIRMARGFRNLDNMIALIYLKCSDLLVPLRNRP